jgi:hypothetical protein
MTPIIDSGTAGSLSLKTNNGATQVSILNSTGADFWELTGGASGGNAVRMQTNGSDTNVTAQYSTKGSGGHDFLTNSAAPETQFQVLRTASATRNITVTGSNGGNPTISTTAGNLAVGTVLDLGSTGQLQFPATQNPSAGVNVLDDYEEGAWTPSLGGSATYTLQNGEYTKVGRLVFFRGSLTVNAIGTGSVSQISGLPFTNGIAQNAACYFTGIANSATSLVSLSGRINASATTIDLLIRAAANASETVGGTIFQAGTAVIVSGCYESA